MPEASEDEWARRFWKRNKTIEATKAKQEYSEWAEKRQRGAPDAGSPAPGLQRRGPRTPDPTDQTVSKREWEKQIKSWRAELRLRSSSRRGQEPPRRAPGSPSPRDPRLPTPWQSGPLAVQPSQLYLPALPIREFLDWVAQRAEPLYSPSVQAAFTVDEPAAPPWRGPHGRPSGWDAAGDGEHPDHDSNGGESIDPPASERAEA
jgi:hypothetical protein